MDDIRYSEFKFLRALESRTIEYFNCNDDKSTKAIGLGQQMYIEMAITLVEELSVRFDNVDLQLLTARLRGELAQSHKCPSNMPPYLWENPRLGLQSAISTGSLQHFRITYRGLRRIEELRDLLRRDRILDDFGVLLSIRYFPRDLEDALQRVSETSVSVIFADMDDFGAINKSHGYSAGNVVMKAYLEVLRDCLGPLGTAYRGSGDETCALILGQGHERAVEIAEKIRKSVEELQCSYQGTPLPRVTSSIGVATTPPLVRTMDIDTAAQDRQRQAKERGKNRVIAG